MPTPLEQNTEAPQKVSKYRKLAIESGVTTMNVGDSVFIEGMSATEFSAVRFAAIQVLGFRAWFASKSRTLDGKDGVQVWRLT